VSAYLITHRILGIHIRLRIEQRGQHIVAPALRRDDDRAQLVLPQR
jgi:hypothetical protein